MPLLIGDQEEGFVMGGSIGQPTRYYKDCVMPRSFAVLKHVITHISMIPFATSSLPKESLRTSPN